MAGVLTLYRSTVGKKVAMAISGSVMVGFVVIHMLGNMIVYAGQEAFDAYGHAIQTSGPIVWGTRVALIVAVVVHVWSAVSLIQRSNAARKKGYAGGRQAFAATLASRSLRYGGVVLLAFIGFHLADLTFGVANPGYVYGEVYRNFVATFQRPVVAAFYMVASVFLGLHLYHGIWSVFQTLGLNFRYPQAPRQFALFIAVLVAAGNLSFPLAVLTGIVK